MHKESVHVQLTKVRAFIGIGRDEIRSATIKNGELTLLITGNQEESLEDLFSVACDKCDAREVQDAIEGGCSVCYGEMVCSGCGRDSDGDVVCEGCAGEVDPSTRFCASCNTRD